MEQMIPGFLEEMLKKQYGEEVFAKILAGYQARRPVTLRVNPLKADRNTVEQALTGAGIAFKDVSWYEDAMIIEGAREPEIQELPIYKEGGIYLQSLSSMLPPLFLAPKAGETVLDMAAAPGGKTTQMAAMTGNQAQITACEKNKARSEKLKYNLE
ncbi:MAG: RsmB/NOP family class I SAM-dependent RNA methyltransferase, partial [Clostridiaceae bacterium]